MQMIIKDLRLRPIVGVHEWEKQMRQDLLINATIEYKGEKAAKSDRVKDTLDYIHLADEIIQHVEGHTFELIERVCHEVIEIILAKKIVTAVSVEVIKPAAMAQFGGVVSVKAERKKR